VTFIAGILDTHLAEYSKSHGDLVPEEYIRHAGCAASRVSYRLYEQREYRAILLGGGARSSHHFSELVGGDMAITIGWSLARQLIEADGPISPTIKNRTPEAILAALEEKLPDFGKSIHENALAPEEFREFGPVAGFQQAFLAGYDTLREAIVGRRSRRAS